MTHPAYAPPPRRNPWPIRIAVGCGAVALLGFLVVVGLVVWVFLPHRTPMGLCQSQVLGARCTQVPPQAIGQVVRMRLPEGTTVRSSEYVDWQDDQLTAEVVVPAGGVAAWEASLTDWPPAYACGDPTVTCPSPCPAGARCARAEDPRSVRTYERYAEPSGGVRLVLRWHER